MLYILVSKRNVFSEKLFSLLEKGNYKWVFINKKNDLSEFLIKFNNEVSKLFFLHWNFIVPKNIYNNFECINIHTSNLPDGKGGSPLQNQICDKIKFTKVNSLQMKDIGLDSGPIYNHKYISLQGSLNDIWMTITYAAFDLINDIIDNNIKPIDQPLGDFVTYKRRKDNEIPFNKEDLEGIYDFIRMLDNNDYPNPFIRIGNYTLEFSRARNNGDSILSDVVIKKTN
jgi:methionyl-tRNA formyltransferase